MRVVILDDHPLMRDAMALLLEHLPGVGSVEKFGHWHETRARLERCAKPGEESKRANADASGIDLMLLDLHLPDSHCDDILHQMQTRFSAVQVVIVSGDLDAHTMRRCLDLGAKGFVPKTANPEVMLNAFRLIAAGGTYVPVEAMPESHHSGSELKKARTGAPHGAMPAGPSEPDFSADDQPNEARERIKALGLTVRQTDVLELILDGLPNKLICRKLDLAEGTVKVHVSAVLRSLGARNRTQAVIQAQKLGIS